MYRINVSRPNLTTQIPENIKNSILYTGSECFFSTTSKSVTFPTYPAWSITNFVSILHHEYKVHAREFQRTLSVLTRGAELEFIIQMVDRMQIPRHYNVPTFFIRLSGQRHFYRSVVLICLLG